MRNGQIKAAVIAGILAVGLLGSMAQVKVTRGWQFAPSFLCFGGCTNAFPALKQSAASLQLRLADDSAYGTLTAAVTNLTAGITNANNGNLLLSMSTPTISSGFGTSPSIVTPNGVASFRVNVGTGGVATSGVLGLPAAATGWNCTVQDITNNTATRMSASTTNTATITAAAAWAASDILLLQCMGF